MKDLKKKRTVGDLPLEKRATAEQECDEQQGKGGRWCFHQEGHEVVVPPSLSGVVAH